MEKFNLFDFGTNENGEYVNLTEEEARKKDISKEQLELWVKKHEDPLIKIAFHLFVSCIDLENAINNDIKAKLEKVVDSKCYHYGNLQKDFYVFSLHDEDRQFMVFENNEHYLVAYLNGFYTNDKKEIVDYIIDDYLSGKVKISFPALYCPCFDKHGNHIEKYADGREYKKDIRHIVCIDEWQMNKFSQNRIEKDKPIKDFYEVEFVLSDLISFFGESEVEEE